MCIARDLSLLARWRAYYHWFASKILGKYTWHDIPLSTLVSQIPRLKFRPISSSSVAATD